MANDTSKMQKLQKAHCLNVNVLLSNITFFVILLQFYYISVAVA